MKAIDSAALWTAAPRSHLGRPATHTRAEITAAAVAIADADGLAAVSMRQVAAAIGAGAMSLYSYVPDKETLVELMIDHVSGEADRAEPTGQPLADLITHAKNLRTVMRRHPWLATALASRQTVGPNTLAGLDHVLAILAPADLDTPSKMELVALVTGFVANAVQYEVAQTELARRTGRSVAESAGAEISYLVAAANSGRYPNLADAFRRPGSGASPVDPFDRLLTKVLSGLLPPAPS